MLRVCCLFVIVIVVSNIMALLGWPLKNIWIIKYIDKVYSSEYLSSYLLYVECTMCDLKHVNDQNIFVMVPCQPVCHFFVTILLIACFGYLSNLLPKSSKWLFILSSNNLYLLLFSLSPCGSCIAIWIFLCQ